MLDKSVDFTELPFVEQQIKALAGSQSTLFVLDFDTALTTSQTGLGFDVSQLLNF
jgi:hypothetical protein